VEGRERRASDFGYRTSSDITGDPQGAPAS
jgi:hypothetical protein